MRKRQTNSACAAYMTVEASLLIPMVLCVIVIALYVAFFLYDRCVLYQDAYILCLHESYQKDEGEPAVDTSRMEEEAQELATNRYFALDSLEASADADGLWSIYEGTADMAPAAFGEYFLMPQDIWTMSFSAKSRKTDPAWSIRSWRRKSQLVQSGISYVTEAISGTN